MRQTLKDLGSIALSILDLVFTVVFSGLNGTYDAISKAPRAERGDVADDHLRQRSSPYYTGTGNRRGK